MEIVHHIADDYAKKFTSTLDEILVEIEAHTIKHHPKAHMISGQVQGALLQLLSQMIKPKFILEIGTFTGFSALCLLKGLQQSGMLHTIEIRKDDADTALHFFKKAQAEKSIALHVGDALAVIPTLKIEWDLIFLDADKTNYINYYELTLPQLKIGGWMIVDNVFFHGEVLQAEIKGKNAKAIQSFNQHILNDNRVQQVMLTVRDGLYIIKKIK
jgi:caffeoyl-CoA O-methyltransferase